MNNSLSRPSVAPARIERLRVENYRALKSIDIREITPLTVLLGPWIQLSSAIFRSRSLRTVFSLVFSSDIYFSGFR